MDNYIPKYVIVQNYIKDKIECGVLKTGDKIPSENELAQLFNCSRATINSAITRLSLEGVVERIKGKGTFVKTPDNILSNSVDGKLLSFKISSKVHGDNHKLIDMDVLINGGDMPSKLMLLPGERYHQFTRLMYSQDKVISFEYSYLPYALYPQDIDRTLIEHEYLHSFIGKYCQKVPNRLQTHISISCPDEMQQKYLKAFKEEPLLLWYTLVIDASDTILGYTENYARPEDFHPYLNLPL